MGMYNRKATVWSLVVALPVLFLVAWWMGRTPYPGSEGGRGPLTAQGLYAQAVRESQRGDRAATERHLRMALALAERPGAPAADRTMARRLRTDLTRVLLARGATEEARGVARPLCTTRGKSAPESILQRGLCDR